jgi:pimeloyl-ACP methyl ester carboxylesterase
MHNNLTENDTSRIAVIDGAQVHFHEAGQGPLLVCIHGGGPAATGWRHFGRNIDALSNRFHTVLIDLPGCGKSDKVAARDWGQWFDVTSNWLAGVIHSLGESGAHVIGFSVGARVALKFALRRPDCVRRMVAIGTAAELDGFAPRPTFGRRRGAALKGGLTRERIADYIETFVSDRKRIPERDWNALVDDWYGACIALPDAAAGPGIDAPPGAEFDLYADLPRITQPTLLLWGRDDHQGSAAGGALMLQRMPNAEMHVFSQCGHWVQWEKPDEFERVAGEFLGRSA